MRLTTPNHGGVGATRGVRARPWRSPGLGRSEINGGGACGCDAAGSAIQPQTRAQPGVGAPALASERRRPLSRVATARVDIADLSGRLRAREPRSLRAQERRRLQPLRKPPSQPPTQRSGMRSCSDAGSSLRNRRSTASFLGSRFETGVRSEPPLPALLPCCPRCRRLPCVDRRHRRCCTEHPGAEHLRRRVFLSRDASSAASRTGRREEVTTKSSQVARHARRIGA